MKTLEDVSAGRDNNLNLIRALAATAVLVSHAYPISGGPGTVEPFVTSLGHSLGTISVYIFFVISGFLITMSYMRTGHAGWFAAARTVRLLPGLVVSIAFVAFVVGLWVTTLPAGAYLTDPDTWTFLIRNITLIKPQYTLPGVFETLPYPSIEGSIWTLFYEVACYGGVFILGITGLLALRGLTAIGIVVYIGAWVGMNAAGIKLFYQADKLFELSVPFALGTLLYLWRDKLPMNVLAIPVMAALCWLLKDTPLYDLAFHLTLAYAVFWVAFIPAGLLRAYNKMGDYSYGIYIYAFPMQGLAVWLYGPQSPWVNMAIALPLTLIPSVLSWHYVEKPSLDWLKLRKTKAKNALNSPPKAAI